MGKKTPFFRLDVPGPARLVAAAVLELGPAPCTGSIGTGELCDLTGLTPTEVAFYLGVLTSAGFTVTLRSDGFNVCVPNHAEWRS